ncbi:glycosyltransferase family 4 protein [Hydrogenothermus marinus]|uniref:UDP-GlcNAc:undecaprenyl-phosphate GlcNAc-1-phosphate transferase n=1 Tax=Hydrogenothermus marinus TaxID=133270 RepID=A0A3M0BQV2_9AQUI|nr:MraY family glycosyltransferase [Hydrogenothermus marinus]RMA93302.1 UDP-GlcNAc:undecaprenyl-phosphate GlcNAc-1-phosphate transferase [Hydrogenothermus marinus]
MVLKIFLLSFFISIIFNYILIKSKYGLDLGVDEKEHALHTHQVSRMGGLAIVIAITITSIFYSQDFMLILASGLAIFSFGFLEDRFHFDLPYSYKISFIAISTFFLLYFTKEFAYDGGFIVLSQTNIFEISIAAIIAFVGIIGFSSAVNFIDGLNGYSMGAMAISLIFFSIIFYNQGVENYFIISIILLGAILGFLIFNFPFGKIFLGDMGAHLIGFIVGYLSIVLANHTSVSLWYPLAIFSIPIINTLQKIPRRIKRKKLYNIPFSESDSEDLHYFMFAYIKQKYPNIKSMALKNSLATIHILIPYFIINLIGFIFRENDFVLIGLFLVSVFTYVYVYNVLKKKV